MNKLHSMYVIFSYLAGFVLFYLVMDIFRFEKIISDTFEGNDVEELNSVRINEKSHEINSKGIVID